MYETFCVECGCGEDDGVRVIHDDSQKKSNIDNVASQNVPTQFHCPFCDIREVIETGVMPTRKTDHFELREANSNENIVVRVDSREISFVDIDEEISTSVHYTTKGIRNTARVHNVHLHAVNPPTVEKGPHRLVIGHYLDEEMILRTVRYHNDKHRTLEFHQIIGDTGREDSNQRPQIVRT